jgi:uncharacterized protein (TIGR03000 family)
MICTEVPAGAAVYANDQEMPVTSPVLSFVTPELEPGRDYYYDFRVVASRDGKTVTRVKRVTVHPGEVVRMAYADMDVR